MAMADATEIRYGDVLGHVYYLKKTGDLIPMHNHDSNSIHLTIVAKGSIKHITRESVVEYPSGSILLLDDENIMHEIRALEDDTRVINILKYRPKKCPTST